jgi:peptide-methionine (R)-S-oxide reductase
MDYPVYKTNEQWRDELNEIEYQVLRLSGTERPFTGELLDEHRDGVFCCRGCGEELFDSNTKFDSKSGWPSFYQPKAAEKVELIDDRSHGMLRTEVRCANCGGHLGHVFEDAPQTPTGERFCINSVSMKFEAS